MTRLPGLVLMGFSALAFSWMAVVIKILKQEQNLPASEIVFFRGLICSLLTIAAMRASASGFRIQRRGLLVLRGVLGFAGLYLYTLALGRIPMPDAMALQYTHPIFAAAIAGLFLNEKMPKNSGWAMGICAAGALIILNPKGTGDLAGNLIGLASGIASAFAYTCVRGLNKTESPLAIILSFHVVACLCSGVIMVTEFVPPTSVQWLWLGAVAVASQAGQWFLTHGLRKEKTGVATTISYLAIAFGAAWAWLIFEEPIGAAVVLGTSLMVLGLTLISRGRR